MGPGNERVYNRTLSGAEYYVDPYEGKYRKAMLSDVKDWTVVVDGTEEIDICTMPYYSDAGLNLSARDVRGLEVMLENTSKPVELQPYGKQNVEYMIEMGVAVNITSSDSGEYPLTLGFPIYASVDTSKSHSYVSSSCIPSFD